MSHDQQIRAALILIFLLTFPILLYHRIKAHTGEKIDRTQEGLFIMITLRLAAVLCLGGLLLYLINPSLMTWSSLPLHITLRWAGVALGLLALTLHIWTLHNLGKNLTDTVITRQNSHLVTTGPYRYVRHPFYVCVALIILANSLATANWFIPLTGSVLLLMLLLRTKKEDQNLLTRFGQPYQTYMQNTPRFIPRFK